MTPGRQQTEPERPWLYDQLLTVARASLRQAAQVRDRLADGTDAATRRRRDGLDQFRPLVAQIVDQATRRVLRGEHVPAGEKVLSLFEPHMALFRRGKAHRPAEFGRKVQLDEVEGKIVTRYAVLDGNPHDARLLPASLRHHRRRFARAPDTLMAGRSFSTHANVRGAKRALVRRVALPASAGRRRKHRSVERQRRFRRADRFWVGYEAISATYDSTSGSAAALPWRSGYGALGGLGRPGAQPLDHWSDGGKPVRRLLPPHHH